MTRRPGRLAVACCAALLALAGCGSEGEGGGSDAAGKSPGTAEASGEPTAGPVACEEGIVGEGPPAPDPASRITDYDARLLIGTDEGLSATEAFTVEFDDSEHHGIYRDFAEDDFPVTNLAGMVDGEVEGEELRQPTGVRLVLGDAAETLSAGQHIFGVSWSADAVLEPGSDVDQESQFDATVLDSGWALDIADATVTIVLPAVPGDISCIAGARATASIELIGLTTVVVTASSVPAGSGVRVLIGVDTDPDEQLG